MKLRLLAALFAVSSFTTLAQTMDVDIDDDAVSGDLNTQVQVPGMSVKMRVRGAAEAGPPPNQGPQQRAPRPPPVQVLGVDTFALNFETHPAHTLRLLSPEGAHADIWADTGEYLGGFDLPAEVPARAGQFYRVVMSFNGALIFDRKVELRQYHRTNVLYRGAPVASTTVVVVNQPAPSMGLVDFPALVEAVQAESFSDAKLDVVRTSEGGLTVDQLGQLVDLFSFAADQVKLVQATHTRLVDRQNAFKLYSHFTFDADKKKVKAILGK